MFEIQILRNTDKLLAVFLKEIRKDYKKTKKYGISFILVSFTYNKKVLIYIFIT